MLSPWNTPSATRIDRQARGASSLLKDLSLLSFFPRFEVALMLTWKKISQYSESASRLKYANSLDYGVKCLKVLGSMSDQSSFIFQALNLEISRNSNLVPGIPSVTGTKLWYDASRCGGICIEDLQKLPNSTALERVTSILHQMIT